MLKKMKNLNIRPPTGRNHSQTSDTGLGNHILNMTPKAQEKKAKIDI
jgi:hypothetical protein